VEQGYSIPENSVAEIYATDILGNKAIRIIMGNSPKLLATKSYLQSSVASDLTNIVASELLPLKDKLETLIMNLNTTVVAVNSILTDEAQKELRVTLANLNKSMQHVEQLTGTLSAKNGHLHNTLENLEIFSTSLRNNSENINAIAGNLAQFTDTLRQTDIKATIDRLNGLLAQAGDTTGTVGQLLYNKELYLRLSSTIHSLDVLLNDIQANPKKYVKLSLF
jgi:phospholipid/cholesterol/gamma-HCH transport system substrate-binding protein